jgi:hypothetical protein
VHESAFKPHLSVQEVVRVERQALTKMPAQEKAETKGNAGEAQKQESMHT